MSEYIVNVTQEFIDLYGWQLCEEIVRCRDCRYYDEIIHACERFDSIKQDNVSYVFDGGFCAWGERREA